jgi:hypothetical protein
MRQQPSSASGQRDAARRHTHRAYDERNELLAVFARMWDAHLMPVAGALEKLDERRVLCIHSPAGQVAYVLSAEEAEDFAYLETLDESHWDRCTRLGRSERLASLGVTGAKKKLKK